MEFHANAGVTARKQPSCGRHTHIKPGLTPENKAPADCVERRLDVVSDSNELLPGDDKRGNDVVAAVYTRRCGMVCDTFSAAFSSMFSRDFMDCSARASPGCVYTRPVH